MPNLVAYLHVRLNLNLAEDAEIYRNITKLPEGERSRTVRIALLAYFKGSISGVERRGKRTKITQVEPDPRRRTKTAPVTAPEGATAAHIDVNNELQPTAKIDSEAALSDMLDLIQ